MNAKNLTIILLAVGLGVCVFLIGGQFFSKTTTVVQQLGAQPGREWNESPIFHGGVNYGAVTSLTSAATVLVTPAQICNSSVIEFAPAIVSSSMTFPSSTGMVAQCLREEGSFKDVLIRNTSTTGLMSFLGNTSTTLLGITTSSATGLASSSAINGGMSALFRFIYSSKALMEVEAHQLTSGL